MGYSGLRTRCAPNLSLNDDDFTRIATASSSSALTLHLFYSGYLPLIIYLGYTRSVPRPSIIKYAISTDLLPSCQLTTIRLFSHLAI